ncbi:uncharacterized protein LOC133198110 [Saccostrea echinata]|uniref:uncharacterized protein LOC133198110 n=1 Tax=Saccostrea echinata TaxID=191078 RepID=UPI002A7F78D0|nr:uncharacterized protein LOC133198110 [Saccostrea echinata]
MYENEIRKLKLTIEDLQKSNHLLIEKVSALETEIPRKTTELLTTKAGCSTTSMEDQERQDEKTIQESDVKEHTVHCQEEGAKLRRLLIDTSANLPIPKGTAFYAYMNASELHPGQHQTIIFDVDVTNANRAYNKHSGLFTASDAGMFVFSWTIASFSANYDIYTEMVVNSNPIGSIITSGEPCCYFTSTGINVVYLNQGDVVYIRTHPKFGIGNRILSLPGVRSTFSGWQIA